MLKLYFIVASDSNDDNLDWFVIASSPGVARQAWADATECEVSRVGQTYLILENLVGTQYEGLTGMLDWGDFARE